MNFSLFPPAETIGQLPRLRYVGVLATGYNIVDVAAAGRRGIVVTNVPTYGTDSVAQFTFALLLELCHRVGLHGELVRGGEWAASPDFCFWRSPQVELAGRTIGIVGLGRIGRRVAEIALAFGMNVIFHDEQAPAAAGAGEGMTDHPCLAAGPKARAYDDLDALFRDADVVSLHVPLTPATHHLVDARRLALMKPSAFLVNTSRGPVVDESALRAALAAGRPAAAALDVLAVEPPPADHPLVGLPNCLVTPHIAWSTLQARRRLMDVAVENLRAFLAGRPINVVGAQFRFR